MVRSDNADFRLSGKAKELGLLSDIQNKNYEEKLSIHKEYVSKFKSIAFSTKQWEERGVESLSQKNPRSYTAYDFLQFPDMNLE